MHHAVRERARSPNIAIPHRFKAQPWTSESLGSHKGLGLTRFLDPTYSGTWHHHSHGWHHCVRLPLATWWEGDAHGGRMACNAFSSLACESMQMMARTKPWNSVACKRQHTTTCFGVVEDLLEGKRRPLMVVPLIQVDCQLHSKSARGGCKRHYCSQFGHKSIAKEDPGVVVCCFPRFGANAAQAGTVMRYMCMQYGGECSQSCSLAHAWVRSWQPVQTRDLRTTS